MKILFVEDNERFARLAISQYLSTHEVFVVPDIAGALQMLQEQTFDAILIDYDLSDGKGTSVALQVRDLVPRPFIVAISSHEMGNSELKQAGADAICSKMKFASIVTLLNEHS